MAKSETKFQKFCKVILKNLGDFLLFSLGLIVFIFLFQQLVGIHFFNFVLKYAQITDDVAAKVMLYIYVVGSSTLIMLFYWMAWESKAGRRMHNRFFSKLVVKDYYRDVKKVDVDRALSSMSRYDRSGLDADKDRKDAMLDGISVRAGTAIFFEANDLIPPHERTDGHHSVCYDNGRPKLDVNYKNGKYDGVYRTYYDDGRLHQEKHYREGKLDGVFRAYDENGILYFEIAYKNDLQHGLDKIYSKRGLLQFCDTYEEGVKINRKTFDERGRVIYTQEFDDEG